MNDKRIILAGGSGYLGSVLAPELTKRDYEVVVLTRSPSSQAKVKEEYWDGRSLGPWAEQLEGARAVVNLTGRSVNCRHTPKNREEIVNSRVESVKIIGEAIRRCSRPPRVLVQAGSLAIYGDTGDQWCEESAPAAEDFPAQTCIAWEKAFNETSTPQTRRVLLRIGIVLGRSGGALKVLAGLTRWGLGGRVGSGHQYISWIHEVDMNAMFVASIEREDFQGVFNAAGPEPATNAEFMRELRRALRRPWSPPAPVWAVHIGSWLMRTEPGLALTGRRCRPKRLLERGFQFKFPLLAGALQDIFPQSQQAR